MSKRPSGRYECLDETQPHTLADFIAESLRYAIYPEGLPDGMTPQEAATRFSAMNDIDLKPLPVNAYYFCGWFPRDGHKVTTQAGVNLFSIIAVTAGEFRLRIEPAAQELLKSQRPSA